MKRKLLVIVLLVMSCLACVMGVTACKTDRPSGDGGSSDVEVTGITISQTTLALEVGDSATLTATIAPNNATDKTVTWQSSDSTVAKVENGNVTALQAGKSTITAMAGGKSATCKVTVTEKVIAVTGVTLNRATLSLEVGDSATLTATIAPNNATDKTVTWQSSDSTVAKVENGNVTALQAGKSTITAMAGGKSAVCQVTVTEKVIPHTHDLTLVPAKQADCETAGNTAYYTCACGKWFSDANAENEVTDKTSVTINATGHSYAPEWTYNETQHWHKTTCKHTTLISTPQNHTFENGVCSVCGYINDLIIFKTLEVNDDTVYGKVSNATTDFSFIKEVTANTNVTYTVSTDKACKDTIPSKTVDLKTGDNVFYVLAAMGNDIKLYTVTLRRRPIYTVMFDTDGGSAVAVQQVEEENSITAPETEKTGHTFIEWTVNNESVKFPYVITQNITLKANFIANSYCITLNVNGGEVGESSKAVTFDSNYTLPAPTRTGYTFTGWFNGDTKVTDVDGASLSISKFDADTTVTAHWQANSYKLTLNTSDSSKGTVSGAGNHLYGSEVTVTANTNSGYTFIGWYDGERLLSNKVNYTFNMGLAATYTAKWEVSEEMSNFNFTSTATTCNITGIKDKTVTEIIVPDYVTSISQGAFSGCGSLESITLPFVGGSIKTASDKYQYPLGYIFGTNSYTGSTATEQRYHGSSTSSLTLSTYYIPSSLNNVKITGGNILYGAFYDCSGLASIVIPDSVRSIGGFTFYGCSGLTSMVIPDSVRSIGVSAFYGCSRLTSVTIPYGVTSISDSAFCGCSSLTGVTIPDGVMSIGGSAFYGCSSLTSITIPDSVTSIGEDAFFGPNNIYYTGNIASWCGISGLGNLSRSSSQTLYIDGKALKGDLVIPDGVTRISDYAFA